MARGKLDVVVVQPLSSKPRVGSALPACSQDLPAGLVTPCDRASFPPQGRDWSHQGFPPF